MDSKRPPLFQRKPRTMEIGGRQYVSHGLTRRFWDDIYHYALTIRWPVFFGLAATIFLLLNAFFALLYQLGDGAIANQFPKGFSGAFFFSVETLATVGYGDMHPQTVYAHCVATGEIFTGMGCIALVTGLIFSRFSRPRAKMLFADHPVIRNINGQQTLMIRAANIRQNVIAEASATLYLLLREVSSEGFRLRRIYDLKLMRDRHPVFSLSWSLMHVIDETSPLYDATPETLENTEALILLTIEGVDETTSQPMLARRQWSHRELRWNHRYLDLVRDGEDGMSHIDYGVFHEVLPVESEERVTP
ncbi:inward rectifier potassium channel [Dyella sp. OK004]|uniref:ion channel n=1 Tax=Dyella sp. OK004 TaxID=1855292 RepID=UPI0008EC4ECC|nr:ion channel [Dyella sp. OK004]SFS14490.1 inward rectifier potassium channel [Dyella sp. OK004]